MPTAVPAPAPRPATAAEAAAAVAAAVSPSAAPAPAPTAYDGGYNDDYEDDRCSATSSRLFLGCHSCTPQELSLLEEKRVQFNLKQEYQSDADIIRFVLSAGVQNC